MYYFMVNIMNMKCKTQQKPSVLHASSIVVRYKCVVVAFTAIRQFIGPSNPCYTRNYYCHFLLSFELLSKVNICFNKSFHTYDNYKIPEYVLLVSV